MVWLAILLVTKTSSNGWLVRLGDNVIYSIAKREKSALCFFLYFAHESNKQIKGASDNNEHSKQGVCLSFPHLSLTARERRKGECSPCPQFVPFLGLGRVLWFWTGRLDTTRR